MNAPTPTCFDHLGAAVTLSRELGRGGEGVVYDIPSQPTLVAKLYHAVPDAPKQAKLKLMVDSIDSPLREYAAWPEDTLHDENGAVIGFTMQRIERRVPIHMLYSPAQRRETFPSARFDFLVFVARNIAAAFETLHAHGHVLGDVNQGNVLVGEDSRVILIDCDSFQIRVGEETHRCKVGVAHFTPPELQSLASFEDVTRTPNHDGFGLALLIFHLLMGGRHPYSGVPLADKVGESLEADIRDFRYAYAADAAQRLIAPPPKSVPIAALPADIVALFERAFSEGGSAARPSAKDWVRALDALRQQLRPCTQQPLHVYAAHVAECTWCALDRKHVTLFGELPGARKRLDVGAREDGPDLDAMEADFARMKLPEPIEMPDFSAMTAPSERFGEIPMSWQLLSAVSFGLGVLGTGTLPMWLTAPALVAGGIGLGIASLLIPQANQADRRGAQEQFERAREQLRKCIAATNASNGTARILQLRAAMRELRQHLAAEHAVIAAAAPSQSDGLRKYLGAHRIARADDNRLNPLQRVVLDAYGIETAADFDPASLAQLTMFDPVVRDVLVEWRNDLIRKFRARETGTPSLAECEQQMRWRRRRRVLEAEVQAAFESLKQNPPQRTAIPSSRAQELQTLKGKAARAYARLMRLKQ